MKQKVAIVLMALAAGGCSGALDGDFSQGKTVNEVLPKSAVILAPQYDKSKPKKEKAGTESTWIAPMTWHSYFAPVPCSDIKSVGYIADRGDDYGLMRLFLSREKYGGTYYPRPTAPAVVWRAPFLWVENNARKTRASAPEFTVLQAQLVADYCDVELIATGWQ